MMAKFAKDSHRNPSTSWLLTVISQILPLSFYIKSLGTIKFCLHLIFPHRQQGCQGIMPQEKGTFLAKIATSLAWADVYFLLWLQAECFTGWPGCREVAAGCVPMQNWSLPLQHDVMQSGRILSNAHFGWMARGWMDTAFLETDWGLWLVSQSYKCVGVKSLNWITSLDDETLHLSHARKPRIVAEEAESIPPSAMDHKRLFQ